MPTQKHLITGPFFRADGSHSSSFSRCHRSVPDGPASWVPASRPELEPHSRPRRVQVRFIDSSSSSGTNASPFIDSSSSSGTNASPFVYAEGRGRLQGFCRNKGQADA